MNYGKNLFFASIIALIFFADPVFSGTAIKYKQVSVPKQNFGLRNGKKPNILHIFYTGENEETSLKTFTDPKEKVSTHYLISADGKTVYRLVPEKFAAWHAGESYWNGEEAVNEASIGVALVNEGISDEEAKLKGWKANFPSYSEKQLETLALLSKDIIQRFHIKPWNIVGHSDIAPQRKYDPGLKFSWEHLAKQGVGFWPQSSQHIKSSSSDTEDFLKNLAEYGYKTPDLSASFKSEEEIQENAEVKKLVSAFQAHFRPWKVDGVVDAESAEILDKLLQLKEMNLHQAF